MLDASIEFMGMTPKRTWQAHTPQQVITDVLRHWFDDGDQIDEVVSLETGEIADRWWLRYRLRVHNHGGAYLVEQYGYYDLSSHGSMRRLQLMCAGYRPLSTGDATP